MRCSAGRRRAAATIRPRSSTARSSPAASSNRRVDPAPRIEPVGRIEPRPWMIAPSTRRVIEALAAGGVETRFVGGCVRDALLGRDVSDVDLATPAHPEEVMRLLIEAGIDVVPTGLKHGTVMAVASGTPFEITTLRRD